MTTQPSAKSRQENTSEESELSPMDALKKMRVVIRAAQRHSSWIEKQCGVTGAQLWLMQELFEFPGLRVGEVAERLAIHQTTTSNLIDTLAKKSYLTKVRDKQDQRVVKLRLTEAGLDVIRRAPQPARGLLPEALGKLDPESLAALNQGLQALLDVIDKVDDSFAQQPLPFTM